MPHFQKSAVKFFPIINVVSVKDIREILNKNLGRKRAQYIFEQMQLKSYVED